MRDLSTRLFPPDVALSESDVDVLLARMATFHDFAAHLQLPRLCTLRDRCNWSDPTFHRDDAGPNRLASGPDVQATIDDLANCAAGGAGAALSSFFEDFTAFEQQVLQRSERLTLLHGDAKPENFGLADTRLVAVDWGALTGPGQAEFDVARFALITSKFHADLEP